MSVEIKGVNSPIEIPEIKPIIYKAGKPVEKGEIDTFEEISCIVLVKLYICSQSNMLELLNPGMEELF
ncbi:hypothetical protein LC612_17040 [Nostoc sp. CHAB 5834]|nr:hypothetical protein [Nostoc sp. CHAB 5834]